MKIALLAPGSSIHTARLANALIERNIEVHLITQHDLLKNEFSRKTIVHQLKIKGRKGYFFNIVQLKYLLKKISPTILHSHYASGYGTLASLSGFHPLIQSIWGSDIYEFPKKSWQNKLLITWVLNQADL